MAKLNVNGQGREFEAEPDTPLLWVLREQLGLTGTKYGCGVAQCGACTVHIDGVPTRTCVLPGLDGRARTRRSSPSKACRRRHRIRCRRPGSRSTCRNAASASRGMIMAAAALLKAKPESHRRRHRRGDDQHLPLRHLQPRARGDQGRRRRRRRRAPDCDPARRREHRMTTSSSRGAASSARPPRAAGGLVVGFHIPFAGARRRRSGAAPARRSTPGSSSSPTTPS